MSVIREGEDLILQLRYRAWVCLIYASTLHKETGYTLCGGVYFTRQSSTEACLELVCLIMMGVFVLDQ